MSSTTQSTYNYTVLGDSTLSRGTLVGIIKTFGSESFTLYSSPFEVWDMQPSAIAKEVEATSILSSNMSVKMIDTEYGENVKWGSIAEFAQKDYLDAYPDDMSERELNNFSDEAAESLIDATFIYEDDPFYGEYGPEAIMIVVTERTSKSRGFPRIIRKITTLIEEESSKRPLKVILVRDGTSFALTQHELEDLTH